MSPPRKNNSIAGKFKEFESTFGPMLRWLIVGTTSVIWFAVWMYGDQRYFLKVDALTYKDRTYAHIETKVTECRTDVQKLISAHCQQSEALRTQDLLDTRERITRVDTESRQRDYEIKKQITMNRQELSEVGKNVATLVAQMQILLDYVQRNQNSGREHL